MMQMGYRLKLRFAGQWLKSHIGNTTGITVDQDEALGFSSENGAKRLLSRFETNPATRGMWQIEPYQFENGL